MEAKGTAFLGRKMMVGAEVGEARFAEFMASLARADHFWDQNFLATSTIPIAKFLAFNEAVVQAFYGGDAMSYFRFGEKSAEWALTAGPYKHIVASKSLEKFAETGRLIYQNYFTAGAAETTITGGRVVDLWIRGIPPEYHHVYFEYAITAYFKRGLELVGGRAVGMKRLRGFSNRDAEVHYQYRV